MNPIGSMPNDQWWPFARQKDFDQFMSRLKGDSRNLKDSAIRAWIEARTTKPMESKNGRT